ncbi:MAG: CPBP family intramembrane metalloprotease [Treponema sp.]|jgi:membrane protease YdiL (CAAX protease family)|nr:CPBP family intramembrane metalloprotease [Treponema sp.]
MINAYIEMAILYAVLFLHGSGGGIVVGEPITFSVARELVRLLLYNIPALALIWYLLLKAKQGIEWGISWPNKPDIVPGLIAFPGLVLIGFTVSLVSPMFEGIPASPQLLPPQNAGAWIILVLSCISTGYLEESFFRFYILSKREEMGLGLWRAALVSVLLFSLCHLYEGPMGFLNSALAGALLAFVFLRFRSLHGVALAHGFYNILVYVFG